MKKKTESDIFIISGEIAMGKSSTEYSEYKHYKRYTKYSDAIEILLTDVFRSVSTNTATHIL